MLRQIITKHTAPSVVKLQRALLSASATQPIEIDEALHSRLIRFRETLKDALEPVEYIHDSANQAFLETDPTSRRPKEAYYLRYATWACDGIDRAMDEYEAIKKDVGSGATLVEMVSQVGFASLLADSMVQRVALRRCVGYGTRKTDLNNWSINWRREAAQPHLHSKAEKVLRQLEGDAFTPP